MPAFSSPAAATAPRAAMPPPCRREAWLRVFVVGCSLPCDPPVGGHSCNGGMIPRFECAVCGYFTLGSAAGADCKGQNLKAVTVVPASCDPKAHGLVGSLRFEPRELHDLGPLFGFVGNEFSEIGGRAWQRRTAQIGKARLELGISESGINLLVELVDDLSGSVFRHADAVP